jgi:hypothetical protein
MIEPPDELKEGEAAKAAALRRLAFARRTLVRAGRRALLTALADRPSATADDVAAAVQIPEGIDPRLLGSVPGELARAGLIEADGFTKSRRRSRHASIQTIWRLADREAARRWLAANPAEPLPANGERPTAATADRSASTDPKPSRKETE